MVLIGVMGNKGSGKTTISEFLKESYIFTEKSFADPLKRACQVLFNLSDDQIYSTQEKKETPDPRWFNCTPRKILQFVGTDLLRNNLDQIMPGLGVNVFTHSFKIWYDNEIKKNPQINIIVSDVRFQNEIDLIQSLDGFVIKIDRPNNLDVNDMHQSEIELRNISTFNYLVVNDGTLDQFYKKTETILQSIYLNNSNNGANN